MTGKHWTPEEEWLLEDLVGSDVFAVVYQRYRAIAQEKGWPVRSKTALYCRLSLLRVSAIATDDNLNSHELARQLGISTTRVRNWAARYPDLKLRKIGRYYRLSLDNLRSFALTRPHLFWGVDALGLSTLIGETYAQHVLRTAQRKDTRRPVLCLETGVVYPSILQAALASMTSDYERSLKNRPYCLAANIRRAARNPTATAYGYHWRYADELKAIA